MCCSRRVHHYGFSNGGEISIAVQGVKLLPRSRPVMQRVRGVSESDSFRVGIDIFLSSAR